MIKGNSVYTATNHVATALTESNAIILMEHVLMDVIVVTMAANAKKVMVVKPKWRAFYSISREKMLRIKLNMQSKLNFHC